MRSLVIGAVIGLAVLGFSAHGQEKKENPATAKDVGKEKEKEKEFDKGKEKEFDKGKEKEKEKEKKREYEKGKEKDKEKESSAADRGRSYRLTDLDDLVVKAGPVTFNNLTLSETADGGFKGMVSLKLAGSCKNSSPDMQTYYLMAVGQDESKEPIWALKVYGSLEGRGVGLLQDNVIVPAGLLKQTANVWLRVGAVGQPNYSGLAGSR